MIEEEGPPIRAGRLSLRESLEGDNTVHIGGYVKWSLFGLGILGIVCAMATVMTYVPLKPWAGALLFIGTIVLISMGITVAIYTDGHPIEYFRSREWRW